MTRIANQRPLVFAVALTGALMLLNLATLVAMRLFAPSVPLEQVDVPLLLAQTLLALGLLQALHWWREAGFNRPSEWRNLRLLIFPTALYLLLIPMVQSALPTPGRMVMLAIVTLLIGIHEEVIYRGIIVRALLPTGALRAALWSGLLFGLIHILSFAVGRDPLFATSQVVASILGGFGLAALRIRTNTIWPLILLHALNDFIQFTATGGIAASEVSYIIPLVKVGFTLVIFAYGMFLLRAEWLPLLRGTKTPLTATR